jgi:SAM-dependent methyltransferase
MLKEEKIQKIIKKGLPETRQNNARCFLEGNRLPKKTTEDSLIGKVQGWLKGNGKLYYLLIDIFAPVLPSRMFRKNIARLLTKYDERHVIVNLGSGPRRVSRRDDIINIDIFAFDEVEVVADAVELPLEDNSVDFIINVALMEHVEYPATVVSEMLRVLRTGGQCFCYLPFIVPYHAAPNDFYRWTISGVKRLYVDFDIVEIGTGAGPASAMLWVFLEWLAILFSFGSLRLHDCIFLVGMVLTFPVKYLDIILARLPSAGRIASGFYIVARKT